MAHGDLAPVEAPVSDRLVMLTGIALTTTSGTLSTASGANDCEGFVLTKVAAEVGRYRATLRNTFLKIQYADMTVQGAADAVAAAAKGQVVQLRNVTKTQVEFQLMTPSLAAGASVDVEPEDAATLRIVIIASRGIT